MKNPVKDGWTRRFIACEPRLSEAVELYRETGFEVLLAELPEETGCEDCTEDDEQGCRICYRGDEDRYRVIYTRPVQI